MRLYEFEGKELLKKYNINIPLKYSIENFENEVVVKAQVLKGKRGKKGGVIFCKNKEEILNAIKKINEIYKDNKDILIEEKIKGNEEYYLSLTYDTNLRSCIFIFGEKGGINIENEKVNINKISLLNFSSFNAREIFYDLGFKGKKLLKLSSILMKLYNCFKENDLKLLEINPLIENKKGKFYACDCKIDIDDSGLFRQDFKYDSRTMLGRPETEIEKKAKEIDKEDYRGVAGSTFIEFNGDIAVLASGGGASLASMDALLEAGGKPANYTEYSGNPPAEKVKKLTEITLSKPGLIGCWVIGGFANFTDIYETLKGFLEGLRTIKPDYPIVIRRAGPRDKEAFEMLRKAKEEEGFDIHLYDEKIPLTKTAEIIVKLSEDYKKKKRKITKKN